MKPWPGLGPETMSTAPLALAAAVVRPACVALVHPHVADGRRNRLRLGQQRGNAARSATSAAATRTQVVSTSAWRLTPSTFLASSNSRGPATGDALMPGKSITAAVGLRRRSGADISAAKDWRPDAVGAADRVCGHVTIDIDHPYHGRSRWPGHLSVVCETLISDGASHHIPVLSRSHGRAVRGAGTSWRGSGAR